MIIEAIENSGKKNKKIKTPKRFEILLPKEMPVSFACAIAGHRVNHCNFVNEALMER